MLLKNTGHDDIHINDFAPIPQLAIFLVCVWVSRQDNPVADLHEHLNWLHIVVASHTFEMRKAYPDFLVCPSQKTHKVNKSK